MDPEAYIPAYLEHTYAAEHGELTPAARELLHDEVARHPERYAVTEHARGLLSYMRLRAQLMRNLEALEDVPTDEEFAQKTLKLYDETRVQFSQIWRADQLCIDAQLVDIQLSDTEVDAQLNDMMKLEQKVRSYLLQSAPGFSPDAPGLWDASRLAGITPAEATRTNPEVIGWLHTLEAIAYSCMESARYRAAARYSRTVMRAEGYPNWAVGTLLLSLARLEDADGFFAAAHEGGEDVEASPWYLLGRALLLYKLGRRKNARRALKEFANRCEGGAFFLLNPTYHPPYLPVRPAPTESWSLSHQAVWEADGIIVDTPDFVPWAASIEGVEDISEGFASRNGF